MNNQNSLGNLLIQVSAFIKKYESIAEITGENFNIFKVLGLETNEVQTHSAFLTELLNLEGSHGRKDVFLKLFIDQMKNKFSKEEIFLMRFQNFKPETSRAYTEYHVGFINESRNEGGRIDILIKDKANTAIIIENKINAGDQKNQLVRYNNAYPNAPIFYLTLNGSQPSGESNGSLKNGKEFVCISYEEDVIKWLDQCLKEAVNHPILRESIRQYINLIKLLTNQTMNDKMSEEIARTIAKNDDFIKALFELQKSNIMADVRKELIIKLKEQFAKLSLELNLDLEWDPNINKGLASDCKLKLLNTSTKYYIIFGFEASNYFGMMYGIYADDEKYDPKIREWIIKRLGTSQVKNGNWEGYLWIDYINPDLKDWNGQLEPWLAIYDGSLISYFEEKIKELVDVTKEIDSYN